MILHQHFCVILCSYHHVSSCFQLCCFEGVADDLANTLDSLPLSEKWAVEGDVITLTRSNPNRTTTQSFKLGEEVVETGGTGTSKVSFTVPVGYESHMRISLQLHMYVGFGFSSVRL